MRHLRPSAEFRQRWQYNNLAYVVASSFPEYLYGIPYTTYVQKNIFAPLGMNDTTYDVDKAIRSGRRSDSFMRRHQNVSACVDDVDGTKFGKSCQGEMVNIGWMKETMRDAGAGGVISSARDMASCLHVFVISCEAYGSQTSPYRHSGSKCSLWKASPPSLTKRSFPHLSSPLARRLRQYHTSHPSSGPTRTSSVQRRMDLDKRCILTAATT